MVILPIGVPLLYMMLLYLARKAITAQPASPTKLSASTRFLHGEYCRVCFWYEPVESWRKLTLIGFVLIIPQKHVYSRLLTGLLTSVGFFAFTFVMRPFARHEHELLNITMQISVICAPLAIARRRLLLAPLPAALRAIAIVSTARGRSLYRRDGRQAL